MPRRGHTGRTVGFIGRNKREELDIMSACMLEGNMFVEEAGIV